MLNYLYNKIMAPIQIINLYSGYSMYEQNDLLHYKLLLHDLEKKLNFDDLPF